MFCLGWFLGLKSQDDHSLLRYPRSPSLQPSRDARQHQHVCFKGTGGLGEDDDYGRISSTYHQTRFTTWKCHWASRAKGNWAVDLWGWPTGRKQRQGWFGSACLLSHSESYVYWHGGPQLQQIATDHCFSPSHSLPELRLTKVTRLFWGYKISILLEMSNTVYTSVLNDAVTSFTSLVMKLTKKTLETIIALNFLL